MSATCRIEREPHGKPELPSSDTLGAGLYVRQLDGRRGSGTRRRDTDGARGDTRHIRRPHGNGQTKARRADESGATADGGATERIRLYIEDKRLYDK